MTLTELGAIGELVGVIAVIGSLIYVGVQVRQSTEQARQSNSIERARANREVTRAANDIFLAVGDPVIKTFRTAVLDFDAISNDDKMLLHNRFLIPLGLHCTSIFLAAKEGLVDEAWAEGWNRYWVSIVKSPGIATWWSYLQSEFQPDFADEIERLLAKGDAPRAVHLAQPWLAPDQPPRRES